jgi:hypothetical protein
MSCSSNFVKEVVFVLNINISSYVYVLIEAMETTKLKLIKV